MEYKIVQRSGKYAWGVLNELEETVQELCTEGWKTQGGVAIVAAGQSGYCTACQAMVKES